MKAIKFNQALMNHLKQLIPDWAIPWVFNFRCIVRRWRFGRKTPIRSISNLPALVIAPHPDDETFGCGGLIASKRLAGIPVRIVFLSNGEGSCVAESPESVARIRQAQALAACKHLGVEATDMHWLNLPCGKIPRTGHPHFDEAVNRLKAELDNFPVGEIYCPHPNDLHPDHEAAAELASKAVQISNPSWCLIYYPVWLWHNARTGLSRRLVTDGVWQLNATVVKNMKDAAMAEYLEAPKASTGNPYCGKLPWGFLWNCYHASEVFFEDQPHN